MAGHLRFVIAAASLSLCFTAILAETPRAANPFAPLAIYNGDWLVRADHPWSGAATGAADRLSSRCSKFTLYFACEQTVNGEPKMLIVYTAGDRAGYLNTRSIAPNGLAGGRGDLVMEGKRWTYVDKPPAGLKGPWSRTINTIVDDDHIQFEEFESKDEGQTWVQTNQGTEERVR